jgi:hypothetical protein
MNTTLRRILHTEVKIIDAKKGLVDYVASDETVDSYHEVIRASGWRFDNFSKNAPFVDSHDYSSLDRLLGKVTDFRVADGKLIERVQWAIDVPDNKLAQLGWKMTEAGYLKAVSVGFFPVKRVFRCDGECRAEWLAQLKELGLSEEVPVRCIYTEQQQIELSCCIIGANPNALARAYKAGAVSDEDIDMISNEQTKRLPASTPDHLADGVEAMRRGREEFIGRFEKLIQ